MIPTLSGYEEQDMMAMPQPQAPTIQPMMPQPTMAAAVQPVNPYLSNPYIDAMKSPLITPEREAQAGQLYDRYVSYLMDDEKSRRADRAEESATKIFGNLIAPAMAVFGGPGTSAAGVQLMQSAQQQVQDARRRKAYEQQNSLAAIKSLVDISKTGLKPAQEYVRDYRKGIDQQQKAEQQAQKAAADSAKLDLRKTLAQQKNTYQQGLLDLRKRGLDISEDRLKQQKEIADQNHNRLITIAQLNARLRVNQQDMEAQRLKQQEIAAYQRDELQLNKFNSEIQAKLQERDSKGNYKYLDAKGQPLDPAQFQLQQSPFASNITEPSDQDIAATMQELSGLQAQPQPQVQTKATGQVSANNPQAQRFQQLIQSGMDQETAAQMYIQSASKRGVPLMQAMEMLRSFGYGSKK